MSDTEREPKLDRSDIANTDSKEVEATGPDEGRRSRSPRKDKPRRKDAGFKWKEKRRDEDAAPREEGLRRGYREHYRARSRSRSRSPRRRDGDRDYDRKDRDSDRVRERRHERRDRDRDGDRDRRKSDKAREEERNTDKIPSKPAAPKPAAPPQEMILVTVNDRLGTKKQIPCLPSDTIKDFKSVVAMMIGRRPHEILLKRQSERPFKDFLTLQDYGISNNVQLDLEVDTGD